MGIEESDSSRNPEKIEKTDTEQQKKNEFNTGGNDSDYDGGHPKDVSSDSKGSIDSNHDNSRNRKK